MKMELERCVGVMGTMLVNDTRRSVEWLVPFTDACAWFEKQAVSTILVFVGGLPYSFLVRRVCSNLFSPISTRYT